MSESSPHVHEPDDDFGDAEVIDLPFQNPEFNQADFIVDDLAAKNGALQKDNSILRSQVAQLNGLLKANANKLGLIVQEDGSLAAAPVELPAPNRATRRARPIKK